MADLSPIRGILHLHIETGTEGGYWALQDERFIERSTDTWPHERWSYDGLKILEDGDRLRIFAPDGSVHWEGVIKLKQYPVFQESIEGSVVGENGYDISFPSLWIHADQEGIDRTKWAYPFFKGYTGELVRG